MTRRALARVHLEGHDQWCLVSAATVVPIAESFGDLAEILVTGFDRLEPAGEPVPFERIDAWLPPVTAPCRIVCQGKNYAEHRVETGSSPDKPPFNLLFSKADSALTGPYATIRRPPGVRLLDYEIELGLVIGEPITADCRIDADNWHAYVAGLVLANDVSARDVQLGQGQWFKGKSYRTFCPVGPWIVPMDDAVRAAFDELELTLAVNGERRQHAFAGQMLFKPWETLAEIATIMDLGPGDLLLTGTPGGVALHVPPAWKQRLGALLFDEARRTQMFIERQARNPRYLKDGDVIEATIRTADGRIDLGMQRLVVGSQ